MKALGWFLSIATLVLCTIGGYILGSARHRRIPSELPVYPVASVGNETLFSSDLDQVLRTGLPAGVERMVEERAILQEAKRLGLTLPEKDFPAITPSDDPSGYRRAVQQTRKAQRLMRSLLLHDVKEDELKHFYETFKEQLQRYEISVILVANVQEATFIIEDLKKGTDFDTLYTTHAVDGPPGSSGRMGFLSRTAIFERFGIKAWEAVSKMKPGTLSPPLPTSTVSPGGGGGTVGLALISVGKVLSSFEDLRPVVEDIFAASQQKALLRRLREDTKVQINYAKLPFLDPRGPSPTPGVSGSPAPSPEANPVPPETSATP